MSKVIILIRKPNQWVKYGEAKSIEEADHIWTKQIKGKGVTAWTEYADPENARIMLSNPSYENQSKW